MESSAPDDVRLRRPRGARPCRAIIGSDDDEGADLPDLPSPAFTSPWPSRHSAPDHGEEKENDPDVSGNDTDKENRAVVCRAPAELCACPRGTRTVRRPARHESYCATAAGCCWVKTTLSRSQPSPAKARDEALRRLSSPTPVRVFGESGKRGLSQMFEEEEDSAPAPQGGDDGATRGDADPGLVEFKPALGGLSQAFEQTQDIPGLRLCQPALEVDDQLRAEAAAIFEKEQEYVIQAAQPASSRPRRELYITENGPALRGARARSCTDRRQSQRPYDALLRTHSDGALGTAHSGTAASSPLTARQPLSTLAGDVARVSLSPSPSPSPAKTKGGAVPAAMMMQGRTAFSELMLGAKTAVHRESEKAKAKKRSEFVEDQAVESDEDDMLGFGGDLVDDAQMDESALAKSKVLEKHLTEDDERLEKEDASDDESSDDEARALRRRLAKKRRVEGDTLDALARDPATAPFHATYQMGLLDDTD
ncbi:hypothetical protein H4582DRAFT_2141813 [Lactarius indigo]|nr:hypothetical protein H4582DRAFT_2141813 [Lactarius indigo]